MFTRPTFSLLIAIVCLTIPFSVSANKPESGEWSGFIGTFPIIDCGDYQILTDESLDTWWIDFFDQEDNLIRSLKHYAWHEDLYREGKPLHLNGSTNYHAQIYFEDGEMVLRAMQGIFFQVIVPGHGNMLFEAGRVILDADWNLIFDKGNWLDWGGTSDFEVICNYLRQE
jgi:hypothetical protein